jgi:hypothetical protein
MLGQIYFMRDELRILRDQQRPESQVGLLRPTGRASVGNNSVRSVSPSSSRPASAAAEQWSTAREGQTLFEPPGRQGTEADMGLVPPERRKTYPLPVVS